ncbi:hypothetical protein [Iningainema tapete]|uniref:hypothetical protein n=1 Tax=Iningainema tapete TaxID=2806730 RepID=UPI001EE1FC88|nr:hypothetical protein [Iningainema tapete]
MSQESEFPFDRARRVTPQENQKFRVAIALMKFGMFSGNKQSTQEDLRIAEFHGDKEIT